MLVFFNYLIPTGPIREIRGPGANVCFGALFFQKIVGGWVGVEVKNFFPDIKKKVKFLL
jgi:hypothetical protein